MERPTAAVPEAGDGRRIKSSVALSPHQRCLLILFVFSLPFCNPWVRGDGVGYYAYVRALLIEHRLDFRGDWKHGNESFVIGRIDSGGRLLAGEYTSTGRVRNLWSIGPSILWSPFLIATHAGVLLANRFGAHVPADGFSRPYRITMALATALYGFLGLWISFALARKYFDEKWAFLATLGIWGASSLPVYMYFNPSWSHAHSAFIVALFVWYWHRTRERRTLSQWILLGLISGLMVDVYYPNGIFLLLPLIEAAPQYVAAWKSPNASGGIAPLLQSHVLYASAFLFGLLPTLISRRIIFGAALQTGYYSARAWKWTSPALWSVLWSSDHGLLSWTPILILALLGLYWFWRADRPFAAKLIVCSIAFYLLIAFYPDWDGFSSFGNRFFISLTLIFVLGLAAFFDWLAHAWNARRAMIVAASATALLILWNFGMMYQWGLHLIPVRGPISWRDAAYNQVAVVPEQAARTIAKYMTRRSQLMRHIENEDVKQLESHSK
jgi:hypothetical protein